MKVCLCFFAPLLPQLNVSRCEGEGRRGSACQTRCSSLSLSNSRWAFGRIKLGVGSPSLSDSKQRAEQDFSHVIHVCPILHPQLKSFCTACFCLKKIKWLNPMSRLAMSGPSIRRPVFSRLRCMNRTWMGSLVWRQETRTYSIKTDPWRDRTVWGASAT